MKNPSKIIIMKDMVRDRRTMKSQVMRKNPIKTPTMINKMRKRRTQKEEECEAG